MFSYLCGIFLVLYEAVKWSPELVDVCEVWKVIKFEFLVMDTI